MIGAITHQMITLYDEAQMYGVDLGKGKKITTCHTFFTLSNPFSTLSAPSAPTSDEAGTGN